MATYGSFPGVRVTTQAGSISSISIGEEEKLVIFGEANYDASNNVSGDDSSLNISASSPEQINARRQADVKFGSDSELADAMKEALANGANISFLYGVAVPKVDVSAESFSGSSSGTGTLENVEILEDADSISTDAGSLTFEFRYDGAPATPTADDTVYLNPLTGEYAVTSGTVTTAATEIDYSYFDYASAFSSSEVKNVVEEDETGVYATLSESDSVSSSLQQEVANLRDNYQLVNAVSIAEPNDTDDTSGAALYDAANYDTANQSVTQEYFYKFAPGRREGLSKTIAGGFGGLFAGNEISDPIYNDELVEYDSLQQTLSKNEADSLRNEDVIPVRSGGSIRVQGNRSTAYSESNAVAADFWTRRIADRVILIGKQVGDEIIGRINDEDTRSQAERLINAEMRDLVRDRLIRPNEEGEQNWSVDVYEDAANDDEVNIDISFSPYGIVKRVDETITVNTR